MLLGASLRPGRPADWSSDSPDLGFVDKNEPDADSGDGSQAPRRAHHLLRVAEGPRRQAGELVALAQAVGRAKLDLLLVGDRHAAPQNAFAPIPLITRLMAEVHDIPLGCVFLAPFHHPVVLAEQLGTISAFADRPFTAAFAIGDTEAQFAAFGMALKSRTVRTDEVVDIVRRLLNGDEVTFDGRYHRLEKVRIGPLPNDPVRIWVGGRRGAAVERAGRLGDAWVSDTRTPDDELVVELERYRNTADAHGRHAFAVLRRHIVLGDTDAEAAKTVELTLAGSHRPVAPADILSGSPTTVVEKLLTYEKVGFAMTVVSHIGGDHERALDSLAMLGEEVLPALRRASGDRGSQSTAKHEADLQG